MKTVLIDANNLPNIKQAVKTKWPFICEVILWLDKADFPEKFHTMSILK